MEPAGWLWMVALTALVALKLWDSWPHKPS
jgi:hypothetical protein